MLVGVLLQSGSIVCESVRLTLVQILLQVGIWRAPRQEGKGKGRSLQWPGSVPIPSLEDSPYNLPSSLPSPPPPPPAALNMAVFLLIGKTSALTMNIAGVVKDWMLIGLSVAMFG